MTDRFEDLLTRTLRERAGVVDDRVRLAGGARREAGAIRRRRLVAAVATVVALVAVAAVVPLAASDRADGPPAGVRELTLSVPPGVRTVVSLDGLGLGAGPAVGWRRGDVFHHSLGHPVDLPAGVTTVVEQGGSTVAVVDAVHPSLRLLDADGASSTPVTGDRPLVDGTGQVAYVDHDPPALVVLSPDGSVARRSDLADASVAEPVGFLSRDRVLVALHDRRAGSRPRYLVAGPEGTRAWQSSTTVQVGGGRVLAGTSRGSTGAACLTALPGLTGAADWRACPDPGTPSADRYVAMADVSPNSHWLIARARQRHGSTGRVAVLDRETGRVVREVVAAPGLRIGQVLAETDDDLLLAVWQDGRAGIVRCGFDGSCDAATTPAAVALADWDRAPMAAE